MGGLSDVGHPSIEPEERTSYVSRLLAGAAVTYIRAMTWRESQSPRTLIALDRHEIFQHDVHDPVTIRMDPGETKARPGDERVLGIWKRNGPNQSRIA